jgi:hypothetical protein
MLSNGRDNVEFEELYEIEASPDHGVLEQRCQEPPDTRYT